MADTGFLSCTATENAANTFFHSGWANASSTLIIMVANVGTNTCKDFSSGTISGTVDGAEVYLINTYGHLHADSSLNIQISINGGSSFSSAISTGAMGTTNTQDLTVGGSSQLWGLDWSGFTDLDQLKVKATEHGGQHAASLHPQIKIHYTVASSGYGNDVMGIDSSDISIVNGIATANISKVNGV